MDVTILDDEGKPTEGLKLSPDDHFSIFERLTGEQVLLGRAKDYYEDAEFSVKELDRLEIEISKLAEKVKETHIKSLIDGLLSQVQRAKRHSLELHFIAD